MVGHKRQRILPRLPPAIVVAVQVKFELIMATLIVLVLPLSPARLLVPLRTTLRAP